MTAAHCICPGKREYAIDKKNHPTHELSVCKKSSNHNQIKHGFNEAKVRGGHMEVGSPSCIRGHARAVHTKVGSLSCIHVGFFLSFCYVLLVTNPFISKPIIDL